MQRLTPNDVIAHRSVYRDRALEDLGKRDALGDAQVSGPDFAPAVIVDENDKPMTAVQAIIAIKKIGGLS